MKPRAGFEPDRPGRAAETLKAGVGRWILDWTARWRGGRARREASGRRERGHGALVRRALGQGELGFERAAMKEMQMQRAEGVGGVGREDFPGEQLQIGLAVLVNPMTLGVQAMRVVRILRIVRVSRHVRALRVVQR